MSPPTILDYLLVWVARWLQPTVSYGYDWQLASRRCPDPDLLVDQLLTARAVAAGAKRHWVSPDGYTRLPDQLLADCALAAGGELWFLKRGRRWEAWGKEELEAVLEELSRDGSSRSDKETTT